MQHTSQKVAGALVAAVVGLTSFSVLSSPAQAAPPARIKGAVHAPGNVALAGIYVSTLKWDAGGDEWREVDSDTTGVDGRYSVGKLEHGIYRVRYYDPSGALATEFYNDKTRAAEADAIDVSAGPRELQPTEMGGAAHLTGKVTGGAGTGIENAEVTAYVRQDGEWIRFQSVLTAADGSYDLGGLPGGGYTLGFSDPASGVAEFWNNEAALADAHTLTVQSSGVTNGLDAKLATPLPVEPVTPVPTVTATATATETATQTTTASPTAAPAPAPAAAKKTILVSKKPVIKGNAKVGTRLRVTKGTINPTAVVHKIQWMANGKVIKKATKRRFKLTTKQRGKKITVRVTVSAPGYQTLVLKTRPTAKVKA